MSDLSCISLFSGGGGLDLGLEAAGFETKFATDVDSHSCITLSKNSELSKKMGKPFLAKAKIHQADVTTLKGEDLLDAVNLKKGELPLLAGGPPCQAFSVFGKRQGRNDPRGILVYHYLRLIQEIDPKSFIFENVYGLLTIEGGAIFNELVEKLSNPSPNQKYKLSVHRLNAVDYGVPQFRDRVFIIGAKEGASIPEIPKVCSKEPDDLGIIMPWRTVSDGLRDLPSMGRGNLDNHTGRKHSQRIIDRYAGMMPGERDKHTRINKLDLSRPSYTIIVGSDAGGGKGHIHPIKPREVTPRESARMQTFPDWWGFSGTGRHPIRQVGNAVPTLLGAAVGMSVIDQIFNRTPNSYEEVLDLLNQNHLFNTNLNVKQSA